MSEIVELTDATFADAVERAAEPVLVDFTARWCAPCRALEPTLEALATDYAGRVRFATLDVEEARVTVERFGVRAMPTLLLFSGGRVVRQLIGLVPRWKLEETVRSVL
jgi:thioredoxin 1